FMDGSISLGRVNVEGAKNVEEIQKKVKDYADAHPNAPWILGRGWSYPAFGAAALPDKKYLDAVVADRPVYLEGFDGLTYWANSKALVGAAKHFGREFGRPIKLVWVGSTAPVRTSNGLIFMMGCERKASLHC